MTTNFTVEEIMEEDPFMIFLPDGTEVEGYFTNARVNKETLPEGWHAYDLREGDSGYICSIENNVLVNHAGTFLTETPIDFGEKGSLDISDDGEAGYTFL